MADDPATVARLGLLADIAAGRVVDDRTSRPVLVLGDGLDGEYGFANVASAVWALYREGLCMQADESPTWLLTPPGRAELNRRLADA